jgi:hypothetical protein
MNLVDIVAYLLKELWSQIKSRSYRTALKE